MMETLVAASGFTSEANLPGIRCTPPYTPPHAKRHLERADSPASSIAGSIHPTETSSPDKKAANHEVRQHELEVHELKEGDVGYLTDLEHVHPYELEELSSSDDDDDDDNDDEADDGSSSSESDDESTDITRNMSRMRCGDEEKNFEQHRHHVRMHRRTDSRVYKRSHSQSVKSETEGTDAEGKDDHDLESSKRRLRRRVQGPQSAPSLLDGLARSSPEAGHRGVGTDGQAGRPRRATAESDVMEIDSDSSFECGWQPYD